MSHLFDYLDFLQGFLSVSPLGLITDIDGTISWTAPTPAQAQVSPLCRQHLALLAQHIEMVAVISGRPVARMRDMLALEGIVYIGNHGFERGVEGGVRLHDEVGEFPALIEAALQDLKPLQEMEGIIFENKGAVASIHYRLCHDREAAKRRILDALAVSPAAKGLRVTQSRMAVELRPPVEVNKGSAVLELIKEYHLQRVLYLGDDLNDLDAFQATQNAEVLNCEGLAIGVIDEETAPEVKSGADFTLDGIGEVERFFEWLTRLVVKAG